MEETGLRAVVDVVLPIVDVLRAATPAVEVATDPLRVAEAVGEVEVAAVVVDRRLKVDAVLLTVDGDVLAVAVEGGLADVVDGDLVARVVLVVAAVDRVVLVVPTVVRLVVEDVGPAGAGVLVARVATVAVRTELVLVTGVLVARVVGLGGAVPFVAETPAAAREDTLGLRVVAVVPSVITAIPSFSFLFYFLFLFLSYTIYF